MKILKTILMVIVVLAIIIVVGSFFLPKTYSVSRSTVINTPDSVIYKNIADLNEFGKWNPWYKMEPSAKITISGNVAQPGHTYEWLGKETGAGKMTITKVEPYKQVDVEMKFIKPFESQASITFEITPEGAGQKVTWSMNGNQNIISKWMSVFMSMDKMIGKDFESGLESLKQKSEKGE